MQPGNTSFNGFIRSRSSLQSKFIKMKHWTFPPNIPSTSLQRPDGYDQKNLSHKPEHQKDRIYWDKSGPYWIEDFREPYWQITFGRGQRMCFCKVCYLRWNRICQNWYIDFSKLLHGFVFLLLQALIAQFVISGGIGFTEDTIPGVFIWLTSADDNWAMSINGHFPGIF